MSRLKAQLSRATILAIVTLFVLSAMARLVSANLVSDPEPMERDAPPTTQALGELELLVRQITEREERAEAREAELDARAQSLAAAEEMIALSLEELTEAQEALEARMFASDTASEADLANLTAIYEGMKPKDAAALFETMDPEFAAGFLARMTPDAASAVFSSLTPLTAYAVSATIAGRNTNAATEQSE